MQYRSEIDGLRALAVMSVVIFHFFPNFNSMGYLGVDIFFVISGFLITTHLISMNGYGVYLYLKSFYSRRIKRIFPALFVFLTFTSIFAFIILIAVDFENYLSSLIASKTFWANWYFWRDGGYFGTEDKLKPLLHMWSLSVEEQFYIFYPMFLLFAFWLNKKIKLDILFLVGFATISSFLLWIYLYYIDGSNPAFFLLPTRSWQFGLGAIVAILHNRLMFKFEISSNIYFILTLSLLLIGLFWSFSQFVNTIVVSFSTSLFIYLKPKQDNYLAILFRNYITIFIGKMSYSLYLYHWPIVVFLGYYYIETPPFWMSFILLLLSGVIGYLSFKLIEKPFRYNFPLKYSLFLIILTIIINLCIFFMSLGKDSKGFVNQWAIASGSNFRCSPDSFFPFGASRACMLNIGTKKNDSIVLLGNSHAQMYSPLLIKNLREFNLTGVLVPLNGCLPTTLVNRSKLCIKRAKQNLEVVLKNNEVKTVFIASTWYEDYYITDQGKRVKNSYLLLGFKNLINQLESSGKNVILFSPIPIPSKNLAVDLPRLINFGWITKSEAISYTWIPRFIYGKNFSEMNSYFDQTLKKNYIKVYDDLCDEQKCYYAKGRLMFFADDNHISSLALEDLEKTSDQVKNIFLKLKDNSLQN
jgi:peptidoglycan/LPS O-acetylase OafA/YrhL